MRVHELRRIFSAISVIVLFAFKLKLEITRQYSFICRNLLFVQIFLSFPLKRHLSLSQPLSGQTC
jgi:hypothetical protein